MLDRSPAQTTTLPAPVRQRLINYAALALTVLWSVLLMFTLTPEADDFRDYWLGAYNAQMTGNPYTPPHSSGPVSVDEQAEAITSGQRSYIYPPLFAYLLQPLGRLDYPVARLAWFAINLLALAGLVLVALQISGSRLGQRYWGVLALAVATAPPARLTLQLGQISIVMALALGGSFLWRQARPALSGLLLALISLIKLHPALLGLFYMLRRPRRVVWWSIAAALALVGLPVLLYGLGPYQSYIEKTVLVGAHYPYAADFNISLAAFWLRLLSIHNYGVAVADLPSLATLLTLLSSAAVLGLCLWAGRGAQDGPAAATQFGLWLCGLLLLSPANGYYNLVLILLPLLVMVQALEQRPDRRARNWLVLGTILICIPPTWDSWSTPLHTGVHTGWGLLLLTPSLYGLLIYCGLLAAQARRQIGGQP